MRVRRATAADLEAILRLEAASEGAAHWRREDYAAMAGRESDWLLVAENEEATVCGFLTARRAADEAEILNLAVLPAVRRRGVGRALVEEVIRQARESCVARIYLEVRASNHPARAFYGANQFAELARRPNYYENPREDAIVLVRKLDERR